MEPDNFLVVLFVFSLFRGRHEAPRNVSQDWLIKRYTNNSNNGL